MTKFGMVTRVWWSLILMRAVTECFCFVVERKMNNLSICIAAV